MLTEGTYSSVAVDDFYEMTLELVTWATMPTLRQQGYDAVTHGLTADEQQRRREMIVELEEKMTDENNSQWYMTWMRCLTSSQLQRHADVYTPYLTNHPTIQAFCAAEVDSLNREVDALQCLALATEMRIAIEIQYLDGSEGAMHSYVIPEGQAPWISLLYRPGHYDILYPNTEKATGNT